MGGDGGSITTRADMVKTKGFRFLRNLGGMGYVPNTQVREGDERLRRSEARDLQLSTCSLSQEPLRLPVVACRLGRLYNKEELLSRLLSKSLPPHMQHISSLKDVQQCVTEINKETHFLVCPVSRVDIRSGVKASIVWPCGCVVSDKARRAAAAPAATAVAKNGTSSASSTSAAAGQRKPQDSCEPAAATPSAADVGCLDGKLACVNCGQPYDPAEDLVPLLPDDEELEKLKEKVMKLVEAKHASKQAKKARTASSAPHQAASGSTSSSNASCTVIDQASSNGSNSSSSSSGSSSSGTSSRSSHSRSSSSSSGGGSSSVGRGSCRSSACKSTTSSKSGEVYPALMAPCATSTRLQAESFAWIRKDEKEQKRKCRDWVLGNGEAVEEVVGTIKVVRGIKDSERAAALP